ncbi:MAG: 3-hydroxybutyryl-CoA dehydrogenase [Clostridia bacterium]|uniref:3-hydroxyacyl-CoA dehydrogenase family protein n=1 Tax=Petroclostridium xylanilyticum TaxID=1792311 RepID=UPI000B995337|nr:3-hydroxyacyl-CoA dehydrogenase family protein [Petroclostridium xylanilyticum]MBZ4646023.1 3-hydroxybutyryl-CoA dehydrogenase [Clostridia bacterium]
MKNQKIGIIGHGLMGKGIAHVFAVNKYEVFIFGRRVNFKDEIYDYLRHELKQNRISNEEMEQISRNIKCCNLVDDIKEIQNLDVIIETVSEDKNLKKNILSSMNLYLNDKTIVASNTSTISITELGSVINKPERFIGMHFFSPVPLMDMVEIVKGLRTNDLIIEKAVSLITDISKEAFIVTDSPGFVFNRMLVPMINEAATLYFEQYANKPEIIDEIMKKGLNLKFGPLKLADLIGIDVIYHSMKSIYDATLDPKYKPCIHMKNMVDAGFIGKKAKKGFYEYI